MRGGKVSIASQLSVVTITTIATTIEYTKGGTSSISGNSLAGHITHLGASTVFSHSTIVDSNIDIATNWVRTIDATTVELSDKGVVDFEGNTACDFVIAGTRHRSKLSSVGVTMWCPLIRWRINFGSIDTRKVKLRVFTSNGIDRAQVCLWRVTSIWVRSRAKTMHPCMSSQKEITGTISTITITEIKCLKLSTIDNHRRPATDSIVVTVRTIIFELGGTHK